MLREPSLNIVKFGFGEPTWDIVRLFPVQGDWSEEAYFHLAGNTHHRIELSDGVLEVLEVPHSRGTKRGDLSWDAAYLFPTQGNWSETNYLLLPSNERLELADNKVETLPMPSSLHQDLIAYLFALLKAFLKTHDPAARSFFASYPVRLRPGKFREPDILLVLSHHLERVGTQYCEKPDLVVEVVSPGNRDLDLETKRQEYAQAGIPEYWIVDPQTVEVIVLRLKAKTYVEHGVFARNDLASSNLLKGFVVNLEEMWREVNR